MHVTHGSNADASLPISRLSVAVVVCRRPLQTTDGRTSQSPCQTDISVCHGPESRFKLSACCRVLSTGPTIKSKTPSAPAADVGTGQDPTISPPIPVAETDLCHPSLGRQLRQGTFLHLQHEACIPDSETPLELANQATQNPQDPELLESRIPSTPVYVKHSLSFDLRATSILGFDAAV
ncbi:hypothetical protein BDW02DRAFT_211122 [Decorospora gaudefroyi]|uniref:Uncharacterized protein n=1 Tax=Decorospora gaudefroyi TaxID=184978 RepID=A0A6A5KLI5_9PLEO|nr:hypothetical protein BDW02DRAFT_211122 [Decorospora gaudefroyi]